MACRTYRVHLYVARKGFTAPKNNTVVIDNIIWEIIRLSISSNNVNFPMVETKADYVSHRKESTNQAKADNNNVDNSESEHDDEQEDDDNEEPVVIHKKRGRPKKVVDNAHIDRHKGRPKKVIPKEAPVKKNRGRPNKVHTEEETDVVKKKAGRPPKRKNRMDLIGKLGRPKKQ